MSERRETVRLELVDSGFTTGMAKAAAATALLDRSLNSLDGTNVDVERSTRSLADDAVGSLERSVRRASPEIDRFSGRLRLIADAALVLGPALVPIGAAAIPAIMGLGAAFGVAAGAAGVAVAAFSGVGDAMKALDAAQLEPTRANLEKMREEFDKIGPAGEQMARYLDSLEPELRSLQDAAREGLFPGVEAGIDNLLERLPRFRNIVFDLSTAMGDLAERGGEALGGEAFKDFFRYLDAEAGPLLTSFGDSLGNLVRGLAEMMVAFGPLTGDFAGGLERMTASFADWADGLSESTGFQNFANYVRESAPMVLDLIGAIGNAFVGLVTAAAPIAQAVVPGLTALASAFAAIAASPIGPPLLTAAAGLVAVNRAAVVATTSMTALRGAIAGTSASFVGFGAAAAVLGTAIGAGLIDDMDDVKFSAEEMDSTLRQLSDGQVAEGLNGLAFGADTLGEALKQAAFDDLHFMNAADEIEALDEALTQLVATDPRAAADAFATIAAEAEKAGLSTDDLAGIFPKYTDAAYLASKAADEAASAADGYSAATRKAGDAAAFTASEVRGLTAAMEEQRAEALGAFDAETRWAQALADARKRAKETAAGIDATTKAGRENRSVLSELAGAWNNQSDAVRNNGKRFREARDAFIDAAEGMGVPTKAAERLARSLLEIPKAKVKVEADEAYAEMKRVERRLKDYGLTTATAKAAVNDVASGKIKTIQGLIDKYGLTKKEARALLRDEASGRLQQIIGLLNAADRDVTSTIRINTIRTESFQSKRRAMDSANQYASGGFTGPGGKHEAAGIVHRGEVVLPQDVVRRDKSLLVQRYGYLPGMSDLPGYATGGYVSDGVETRYPYRVGGAYTDAEYAAMHFADTLRDVGRMNRRELNEQEKELRLRKQQASQRSRMAERELESARDRLSAMKDEIRALRESRQALVEQVGSQFNRDVFGEIDLEQAARDGLLPSSVMQQIHAWGQQQNQAAIARGEDAPLSSNVIADWVTPYLETLTQSQIADLTNGVRNNILTSDTRTSGRFETLLKQLDKLGLDGGAFQGLAESGNSSFAQWLVGQGKAGIDTFESNFEARNRQNLATGNAAASPLFDPQIAAQAQAIATQTAEVREMNQRLKRLEERAERREKQYERFENRKDERLQAIKKAAAKDGPDRVAAAVNGAVSHGQRSGK